MRNKTTKVAQQVYDRMQREAVNGLWTGRLSDMLVEMEGTPSYYSHVTRLLKHLELIGQEQRGGRGGPSVWRILQTGVKVEIPDQTEERRKLRELKATVGLAKKVGQLETRLGILEAKVERLEADHGEATGNQADDA